MTVARLLQLLIKFTTYTTVQKSTISASNTEINILIQFWVWFLILLQKANFIISSAVLHIHHRPRCPALTSMAKSHCCQTKNALWRLFTEKCVWCKSPFLLPGKMCGTCYINSLPSTCWLVGGYCWASVVSAVPPGFNVTAGDAPAGLNGKMGQGVGNNV